MIADSLGIIISFVCYILVMLMIGWYFFRKTSDLSDYILGGRGLNSWVTSLSAQASDMSGWLLLGLPGYAYLSGLNAVWLATGLAIGTYLNWKFVARRLRKYTEVAGNSITLPDYFEHRFQAKNHSLRIIAAIFIIIFFLIYTASGFVAGAKLFNTVFGMSYLSALSTGVAVIIVYTFLGGFMAVSWTDFIQGIIMFFAIVAIPVLGMMKMGGIDASLNAIREVDPQLLSLTITEEGKTISAITIISLMAWGLGYWGQPHILARFMAIRHSRMIKKSRRIAMVWVLISLCCAIGVGLLGNVLLESRLEGPDSETVFMYLVDQLSNPLFTGLLLSAILAAIMSTADSQLLVASSALTEDIYRLVEPDASQKKLVWVGRLAVILIAIIAFFIAFNPEASVLELVAYAWAGFGATFGPLVLLSLYWKKMTYSSAIAGIISGGITVLVWKQLEGGIFNLYEIVPGFIVSVVFIVSISLWGRPVRPEVEAEYESVESFDI